MKESWNGDYGPMYGKHKSSVQQLIILTHGFSKYPQDNAVIFQKKSWPLSC